MQGDIFWIDRFCFDINKDFLGQGSFGKVYKGKDSKSGQEVAIKILEKSLFKDQFLQDALRTEIQVMMQLQSNNVVRLYDVQKTQTQIFMILEYCPEGDLRKFLQKQGGMLDEPLAVNVMKQLMKGFQDLIQHGYMHRDIKPDNALVKQGVYKVADFGFATRIQLGGQQILRSAVGTPLYMSPQLLSNQNYTAKSDIWSIGMMYFELLFGKYPWPCRDINSFLQAIKHQPLRFPIQKQISEESRDFITQCLQINEDKRIGWEQIFDHPLLKSNAQQIVRKQSIILDKYCLDWLKKLQSVVHKHNLKLQDIFNAQDKNKDNLLDYQEFLRLIQIIDPAFPAESCRHLFTSLLRSGQNSIDFIQFQHFFNNGDFSDLNNKAFNIIEDLKEIIITNKIDNSVLFNHFDKDHQGQLDLKEFTVLILRMFPGLKQHEIKQIFYYFDRDKSGKISHTEFIQVLGRGESTQSQSQTIQRAKEILNRIQATVRDKTQLFASFDKNRSHFLDKREAYDLFKSIDPKLTHEEFVVLFKIFDRDNNGSVSFQEFQKVFEGQR